MLNGKIGTLRFGESRSRSQASYWFLLGAWELPDWHCPKSTGKIPPAILSIQDCWDRLSAPLKALLYAWGYLDRSVLQGTSQPQFSCIYQLYKIWNTLVLDELILKGRTEQIFGGKVQLRPHHQSKQQIYELSLVYWSFGKIIGKLFDEDNHCFVELFWLWLTSTFAGKFCGVVDEANQLFEKGWLFQQIHNGAFGVFLWLLGSGVEGCSH